MYKPLFLLKSIHLNTANGICVLRITVLELHYFPWLKNNRVLKDLFAFSVSDFLCRSGYTNGSFFLTAR